MSRNILREAPNGTTEFNCIVGLINPHASRHDQTLPQLEALKNAYADIPYHLIETDKDFVEARQQLLSVGKPDDLVVVVGGDGTKSAAAETLCETGGIMLPLPGGNGNDLDTGLFGRNNRLSSLERLKYGAVIKIRPLDVAVNGVHQLASMYAGIGATGRGSAAMNHFFTRRLPGRNHDAIQSFYDLTVIPGTSVMSAPFIVRENGNERWVTELSFVNGPSMAKYAIIPVLLEHPEAFVTERTLSPQLLPWALKGKLGTLIENGVTETYLREEQLRSFRIGRILMRRSVTAHIDAQPFQIPVGSKVEVGISEKSFRAISTSGVYTPR